MDEQASHYPSSSSSSSPPPALPFKASSHANDGKYHILLAATGSVATIKLPLIARALGKSPSRVSVRIILTGAASRFLLGQSPEQPHHRTLIDIPGVDGVYMDGDEWARPWARSSNPYSGSGGAADGSSSSSSGGTPTLPTSPDILHIELRRWADVLLVAPLSANSLAKMANGMSDNLLLSVIRAWDVTGLLDGEATRRRQALTASTPRRDVKRVFVAPAMNTMMWAHPITARQLGVLREEWGYGNRYEYGPGWVSVISPMEKSLACGDVGAGAMEDWRRIVEIMQEHIIAEGFQL